MIGYWRPWRGTGRGRKYGAFCQSSGHGRRWLPKNGYHGPQSREPHETTQWGLTFTTLFNVLVDSVVWHWLSMTLEDVTVIHDGLVHEVGRSLEILYADDGLIGSQDPEWLQGGLNVPIGPLLWIGLM